MDELKAEGIRNGRDGKRKLQQIESGTEPLRTRTGTRGSPFLHVSLGGIESLHRWPQEDLWLWPSKAFVQVVPREEKGGTEADIKVSKGGTKILFSAVHKRKTRNHCQLPVEQRKQEEQSCWGGPMLARC